MEVIVIIISVFVLSEFMDLIVENMVSTNALHVYDSGGGRLKRQSFISSMACLALHY